jgi:phage recombination protein Bet
MTAAVPNQSALAMRPEQTEFDDQQVEALMKSLRIKGATRDDLRVFFHQCRKVGLDPFLKQIYLIMRLEWDPDLKARVPRQTIQIGIDGFRSVARREAERRHEQYGVVDKVWYDKSGEPHKIWTSDEPPFAAGCTVLRGSERHEVVVYYSELVPLKDEYEGNTKTGRKVPSGQWATAPRNQLMKCAEAAGLRAAFPQDLSGIYAIDEMEQADNGRVIESEEPQPLAVVVRPDMPPRNWEEEIEAAETGPEVNDLWNECLRRGEMTPALRAIAKAKAKALKQAEAAAKAAAAAGEPPAEPVAEPVELVAEPVEPVAEPVEPVAEPVEGAAVEPLGACILVGEEGEDPDDHSTHDHTVVEPDDGEWEK